MRYLLRLDNGQDCGPENGPDIKPDNGPSGELKPMVAISIQHLQKSSPALAVLDHRFDPFTNTPKQVGSFQPRQTKLTSAYYGGAHIFRIILNLDMQPLQAHT